MTIKQKLSLGIGTIIASVAINTIIGSINLSSISTISTQTATESVPFATLAGDAKYQSCQVQQFVTDSSLTKDAEVMKEAEDAHGKFMNDLNKFEEMYKSENNKQGLADIETMRKDVTTILETGKRMAVAYTVSQEEGNKVMEELDKATGELATRVEVLQKGQVDEAVANSTATMEKANSSFTIGLIFGIITLIIGIVVGYMLTRDITNALTQVRTGIASFFRFLNRETTKAELIDLKSEDEFGQMATVINENIAAIEKGLIADANAVANAVQVANKVKSGHLNEQINVIPNNPQLVELRNVLNEMLAGLNGNVEKVLSVLKVYAVNDFTPRADKASLQGEVASLIDGVNNLGNEISTMLGASLKNGMELQGDASNLKQAVEALSTASNQQAASLEETAAAMEEMTSNVQNNAQKSNEMASMAAQTDASAKEGAELAQRTAQAMTEIQSATNSINDAVAIIENIAFQTNILSLNAAVEAATAGDAGKGFAVVAQEVRNLANRSADAAKEIKALAAQAARKSDDGMSIANELTRGFEVIAEKIEQTTLMVQDVSNASREQMQGIGQINTAVTQLDQMTQENAKIAAEADSIANATIDKAQAMVADASSKNFVGKSAIQASQQTQRTVSKPSKSLHSMPARQTATHTAVSSVKKPMPSPAKPSKHDDDVWESF